MRRWTLRICVFLLLGAIVNVAVAWGFVTWTSLHPVMEEPSSFAREFEKQADGSCCGNDILHVTQTASVGFGVRQTLIDAECLESGPCISYAYSARAHGTMHVGWPLFGVSGTVVLKEGSWRRESCLRTPLHEQLGFLVNAAGWRDLPFAPIWPGFAINTLFYAAILWLLFAAPLALRLLRGRKRLKRGLCPACAYDLRGSRHASPLPEGEGVLVCPECGRSLRYRSRPS